jgi:hypothetical protein
MDNWNENYNTVYFRVFNNDGHAEFEVDTDNDVVNFNRRDGINQLRVNTNTNGDNRISLNNNSWLQFNDGDESDISW